MLVPQKNELTIDNQTRIGKYTGNIESGQPNGYGVFVTTNPNGFSWHYIGNWRDGLMHGEGATYWEDGSLEIGSYEYGNFVFGYCSYDGADLMLYSDVSTIERTLIEPVETETPSEPTMPVVMYIGNKNSKVFHYPDCNSVNTMKEKNKIEFYTREEAEACIINLVENVIRNSWLKLFINKDSVFRAFVLQNLFISRTYA